MRGGGGGVGWVLMSWCFYWWWALNVPGYRSLTDLPGVDREKNENSFRRSDVTDSCRWGKKREAKRECCWRGWKVWNANIYRRAFLVIGKREKKTLWRCSVDCTDFIGIVFIDQSVQFFCLFFRQDLFSYRWIDWLIDCGMNECLIDR